MKKLKLLFIVITALIVGGGNAAWAGTKTVYLNPDTDWKAASAWYALYMYDDTGESTISAWSRFYYNNKKGLYEAEFNDTYKSMMVVRKNPQYQDLSFTGEWNRIENLPAPIMDGMIYNANSGNNNYTLSGNTFYLYNVGVGKYLCSGNNYGTHASVGEGGILLTLIIVSKTQYKISTTSIYQDKYIHDDYMDSGEITNWTFDLVSDDVYKIKDTGDANKVLQFSSGTLVVKDADPNNNYSKWRVVSQTQFLADMKDATQSSPLNVTSLINNYYFAWGNGKYFGGKPSSLSNSSSWQGDDFTDFWGDGDNVNATNTNFAVEQFEKVFDNYQALSVPNGKYFMTAKGFYRGNKNQYIYANNEKCYLKEKGDIGADNIQNAAIALKDDTYLLEGVNVFVTNGQLRVGVKCDSYSPNDWCAFDEFSLIYYGNAVSYYNPSSFSSGAAVTADAWYSFTVPSAGWYTITPTAAGTFCYTQNDADDADNTRRFYAPTTGKIQYLTAGAFYFKTNTAATVTVVSTPITANGDVTGYINDPSFEHVTLHHDMEPYTSTDMMDWVATPDATEAFISHKNASGRTFTGDNGNNLYNTWGGSPANGFFLKQTLPNLPLGNYRLTCYVASDNTTTVNVALGSSNVNQACTDGATGHLVTVDFTNTSVDDVLIALASTRWFKADNFTLTYQGLPVAELPGSGDMAADTWYYFDPSVTGIYNIVATTLNTIVCTTSPEDVAWNTGNPMISSYLLNSGTRVYVKSSTANNLAIGDKICDNESCWFLRTSDYKYLSRGGTYYSQAVADNYGIPIQIAYVDNNINFRFVDNWQYLYDAGNQNVYTDDSTNKNFALESTDGGYYVVNKNDNGSVNYKLFIDDGNGNRVKSSNSNSTVWVLESVTGDVHKTRMQALKDGQAAAVAAAAGFTGQTTQSGVHSSLSSITDVQDLTSSITNPTAIIDEYQKDAPNNGEYSVCSYSVSGLATGLYKLSVKAFERISNNDRTYDYGGGNAGLTYVYANDQKVQLYSVFDFPANNAYADDGQNPAEDVEKGGKHYPNSTVSAQVAFDAGKYVNEVFVYVTNGTINYGINIPHSYEGNSVGTSCGNWICCNNFTLTYYAPCAVTIDEDVTYTPIAKYANVTLHRTLGNAYWNTFCVPFAISNAELSAAFGSDVEVATYSESASGDLSTVTFTKMAAGERAVSANTPVLLKPSEVAEGNTYTFTGRTIVEGTPNVSGGGHYDFVGSYTPTTYVTTGNYYLWTDNKIYKSSSDNGTYINGTRAYIKEKTPGSARIVNFSIEEGTQGIEDLNGNLNPNANGNLNVVYNLKGQKVSGKKVKGIYVVNGKRVVIK